MARLVMRFVRVVALVVVCLVAAELTARIDDYLRYDISLGNVPSEGRDLTIEDSLGFHGRPNGRYRWWRLNAYGFRAPEMTVAPRPDCTRIMVLGASETFGLYETPGMDYPAQLQRRLSAPGCYEVINAAIAGASVHSMLGLWRRWVSPFKPRLVVIYPNPSFYLNTEAPGSDAPDAAPPKTKEPWWTPRLLDRMHRTFHYPDILQRRRVAKMLTNELSGHDTSWIFARVPADRLSEYDADLDSLVVAIQADGASPVLATHAMPFTMSPTPGDADLLQAWRRYYPRATQGTLLAFDSAAADATRRIGRERGVPVVDLAAQLNGHSAYFADFTHYTDIGAGAAADILARELRTLAPPASAGLAGAAR
jgi:hypothetical protein